MVDDLPTGYYLENFNYLLDFVHQNYEDILVQEEIRYRSRFQALSIDAARLYVRLTGRRGPLFRVDKLAYPEIENLAVAIDQLIESGFLTLVVEHEASQLLALVTKQELICVFDELDKTQSRDLLDEFILAQYPHEQISRRFSFDVIEPLDQAYLQLYKLLFFGNLHQDFTEFVVRDLGISPFETYALDSSARYFDARGILEGVLESYAMAESCRLLIEEGDTQRLIEFVETSLLPLEVTDPRLHRRYSRLFNSAARQLERYDRVEQALPLYEKSNSTPARERRSRIYHKLGDIDRAIAICREINAAPIDEAEHEFSTRFSTRLCKSHRLDCSWLEDSLEENFAIKEITVEQQEDIQVEALACNWFIERGMDARYVENGLLPGLFGLYFWDVIFAPIKGVFFNPFQRGPADLFTPDFHISRRGLIEDRLDHIHDEHHMSEVIQKTFAGKFGIANRFVNWRWLDEDLIRKSLERIPITDLERIFQRMLRDLRANRAGFPDLIVFPPEGGYRLSEIKGPGDRLQHNQRRWFRFFGEHNIPANIINVVWK